MRDLLGCVVTELLQRAEDRDQSKLESPEAEVFAEVTPKLAGLVYGSDEYRASLREMKPALDHHNRHHPEFFEEGVYGMTLVDVIEMLVDWKAAGERHAHSGPD